MKNLLLLAGYVCLLGGTALVQAAINYADFDLDWIDDFDGVSSTSCTKANCGDCIDFSPMCMTCPDGYAETDDQQKCVECPSNCEECEAPTEAELACTECASSYFIDSNDECTQCDTNCAVCASVDTCSTCNEGYFLQDDGSCSACSSRCSRCSSADVCSVCMEAAYKDGDVCKACPSNAKICELQADGSTVTVSECYENYIVHEDNDKCLQCSNECATCSNVEAATNIATCLTCEDNYYHDTDVCEECSTNCKECTGDSDCSTCKEEYIIKPEDVATCQECTTRNCASCTVTGSGETCNDCVDGYHLDEAACRSCMDNCGVCSDGDTCDTCKDGYGYQRTAATPTFACLQLPDNCATLNPTADSPTATCATCNEYYYLNGATCTLCIPNCKQCDTSADACDVDQCDDGYDDQSEAGTVNNEVCMVLPANCIGLKVDADADEPTCDTCATGYRLDTTPTPPECVACTIARCDTCSIGTTSVEECDTCASDTFGSGTPTDTCTRCVSNCMTCTNADTCGTCEAGYGKNSDSTCEACATACTACEADVAVCTQCEDRYIPDSDGVCQICPDNCGTCTWDSANSRTVCTANNCDDGYSVNSDGDCVECPRECDECSLVTVDDDEVYSCDVCNEGYGRNTYFCADCPSNCHTCSYQDNTGVSCTGCDDGYYLSEGVCEACTTNCEMCTSSQCQECADGYGLSFDKQTCVDCEDLTEIAFCELCGDHPDYENDTASCEECASGYYLKDQIANGTDAECVAVPTTLDCGTSVAVFDPKPVCKRTSCNAGYTNLIGECVILCFMCGDPRVGTYVPTADCITQNGTDGVRFAACEDECYANYREINGVSTVTTGCIPEDDSCPTTDGCSDTTNGETCELCCEYSGCNEDVEEKSTYGSATRPSLGLTMMLVPLIMLLLK